MDGKAVEQMLGQPSLQRRERPAQYWRYNYGECAIDLYFYNDGDEGKLIVRHYEVRVGSRGAVGAETCQRLHDGLGPADAWNSDDMASF
jgi:hypothetical protein